MKQMKKSVHFALDHALETVHTVVCDHSATSSADMYVSDEEFKQSKYASLVDGCKARKEGLDELLEDTFLNASPDVQKRLNQYSLYSDYRGVERFVNQSHAEERRIRRERAIQAVLIGQHMARTHGLKADVSSAQLRKVALVYGASARLFARRLGKADEAACDGRKRKGGDRMRTKCKSRIAPLELSCTSRAHCGCGALTA